MHQEKKSIRIQKPKFHLGENVQLFTLEGIPAKVLDITYSFHTKKLTYYVGISAYNDVGPSEKYCLENELEYPSRKNKPGFRQDEG